jgi:hypothetical protein
MSAWLSTSPSTHLPVSYHCAFITGTVDSSIHQWMTDSSFYLSIYLSFYLSFYLSIYLSIFLSIYLSIYRPVFAASMYTIFNVTA